MALTERQRKRIEYVRRVRGDAAARAERQKFRHRNSQGSQAGAGGDNVARLTNKIKLKKPGTAYTADVAAEEDESRRQLGYFNPNVNNPFGSTRTSLNPDGTVSVDQSLSQNQQGILDRDEQLSMYGRDLAMSQLQGGNYGQPWQANTADRSFQGGFSDDRLRIEDAVFNNLTRDLERDRSREVERAKEVLYNQGVTYSDDPNSKYQKVISDINKRYDTRSDNARLSATQYGGQEMSNQFGMQEQLVANQFGQAQATDNQNLQRMNHFGQMGSGLLLPNFQQYQAPNYDVQDPSSLYFAAKQLRQQGGLARRELDLGYAQLGLQRQMANAAAGAPAPPLAQSPFQS